MKKVKVFKEWTNRLEIEMNMWFATNNVIINSVTQSQENNYTIVVVIYEDNSY